MSDSTAGMFPPPPDSPHDALDKAVRGHLEAEAAKTNPSDVWAATLARLDAETPPASPPRRRWRGWISPVMLTALAASLFFAVYLIPPAPMAAANPAESLRTVRATHRDDADRSYRISVTGPAGLTRRWEKYLGESPVLHPRGNRFYQERAGSHGYIGRDGDGRIWIAPTREAAVSFEPGELPASLREIVTLRGLELPAIIDDVLGEFDLDWFEGRPETKRIIARRKTAPRAFQLAEADIQLDPTTRLIESLTLARHVPAGERLRITFHLTDAEPRQLADYTPRGHLEPTAPVYESDRPIARRRVLLGLFGEALLNGG